MNIIVPIKQVPDLVEELEIDANGKELNKEWLKLKINEFDDHALEEALCLKEEHGGTVTVVALDGDDIDKALFTASAKGADRLVRITGADGSSNHAAAAALAKAIEGMSYDLVLTGVQAADDRDGQMGVLLAHYLKIPHICVVTHIDPSGGSVTVQKEYGGGTVAEFSVGLPAVLGVQAARQAPRYVPVARVRQVMRSAEIEDLPSAGDGANAGSSVSRMFKPESGGGAEMLSGSASEVADRIIQLIRDKGVKI